MHFSICIITKNEADKLEKCLVAAKKLGEELVVVDTGSTDNTKEIMKKYADIEGEFQWCDDFAKAKNYVAHLATHEWILLLDTDEYVMEYNKEELLHMMEESPRAQGSIKRRNHYIQDGEERIAYTWTPRFYNRNVYEFRGRIHEQLVLLHPEQKDISDCVDLHFLIEHDSYENTRQGMEQKAKRNKRLLIMDLQENGEEPYTLFQLGKSCYTLQQYEEAAEYFSRGLEFDLDPNLEYVIDMVESYGYALINSGQAQVALGLESVYDTFCGRVGFVFMMGLVYMNVGMLQQAVNEFEKATHMPSGDTEGTNSYLAYYNIGVIFECLGDMQHAVQYYKKCGNYTRAKERLRQLGNEAD